MFFASLQTASMGRVRFLPPLEVLLPPLPLPPPARSAKPARSLSLRLLLGFAADDAAGALWASACASGGSLAS